MRSKMVLLLLFTLSVMVMARPAEAKHIHFLGGHPIPAKFGGGYCYIESPHMHVFSPDRPQLYQQVGNQWVFTADPTPFGYEGERHTFYGHHPVAEIEGEPIYCYISGPHYHSFAPPGDAQYSVNDGVAFYVGPFTPAYVKMKPHRVKVIDAEYRPFIAFRPTVEVAPPPEWHGDVYVASPAVQAQVQAPGVYVERPHAVVEVSAPGVVVARPAMHVVVSAPPPVVVAPSPVLIEGGRGYREHDDDDDDRGRWHHDNGKHKGWYKHGRD